jgi:protein-S-isoprenylcysteine O-methyltransferase Ste14
MPQDFEDSAYTRASLHRALRTRKQRRRWQQVVGLLLLLAGYASLAVSADAASEWLLLRVVGGFVLLFVGFTVAIGPTVAALLGDHD